MTVAGVTSAQLGESAFSVEIISETPPSWLFCIENVSYNSLLPRNKPELIQTVTSKEQHQETFASSVDGIFFLEELNKSMNNRNIFSIKKNI